MTAETVLPLLTGPVAALVVMVWWIVTLRLDIKELRKTIEALQRRADSAEEAARTSNELINGLIKQSVIQRGIAGGE